MARRFAPTRARARNTVVVMDNANIHRANRVTEMNDLGLTVMFLPVASSELNPIEKCWAHLKRNLKQQLVTMDYDELRRLDDDGFREQLRIVCQDYEDR